MSQTTPSVTRSQKLSSDDVTRYRREGFLQPQDPVLAPHRFAALAEHFERTLAARAADVRPEDLDVPHITDPALFAWLFDPNVLDLVEPLLGPDIALFSSHFICKPAGVGRRVPWHQDSFYWKHMLTPMNVVTVWLAIDPSTSDNGAMQVIPRSHAGPTLDAYDDVDLATNTFPRALKAGLVAPEQGVTMTLAPNHASLHDAGTIHGSPPNNSAQRRCGFTMRYTSTRVKLSDEAATYHQLYLARGRDHAGNHYNDPGRAYPELLERRARRVRRGH